VGNPVDIDKSDINHATAANCDPSLYPGLRNVSIDHNVKVRVPVLLEFKDADVVDRGSILATQIDPKHCENPIQVLDGVTLDLCWIER